MGPRKGECLGGHPSHEFVAGMSPLPLDALPTRLQTTHLPLGEHRNKANDDNHQAEDQQGA